jgi:magnesium transporter
VIRVVVFEAGGGLRSGGEELLAAPLAAGDRIWIDLEGPDKRFEGWLRDWDFHPLAIEDTFTLQHQPKVEEYDDTMFVIVRGLDFNVESRPGDDVRTQKLAAFFSATRLVTLHRAPMRSVDLVCERLKASHRSFPGGPVQVLWTIYDEMMDHYFPVVDELASEIERLEEVVVEDPAHEHLEQVLAMRRKISTLRRIMLPHRQVFGHLANSRFEAIDSTAALNFRDTQDNVLRLADALEQQRDLLTNVKDTYLSVVAQRTNEIMRVLTVFSAIVLPLSLVAGVYGMNFRHMPELESRWGYPGVLLGMAALAAGLLLWFRKKRWI